MYFYLLTATDFERVSSNIDSLNFDFFADAVAINSDQSKEARTLMSQRLFFFFDSISYFKLSF